ncbi:MAG: DUF4340 domain-containing protein [Gammaproteobacteria bacterium]
MASPLRAALGWSLLLAGALAAGAWLLGREHGAGGPAEGGAAAVRLFGPEFARLTAVTVEQADASVRVANAGGAWRYPEGAGGPATSAFVRERLTMLGSLRSERRIAVVPADLERFGLDAPLLRLRLEFDPPGGAREFAVGRGTPDGFGCYLFEPGRRLVHVVPAYQARNLLRLAAGPGA